MQRPKSAHELRCFCRTQPLLAVYGLDQKGELYIHVRIYKQSRIYGELIIKGGEVKLLCRECLRWHRIVIRPPHTAELVEEPRPPSLAVGT